MPTIRRQVISFQTGHVMVSWFAIVTSINEFEMQAQALDCGSHDFVVQAKRWVTFVLL